MAFSIIIFLLVLKFSPAKGQETPVEKGLRAISVDVLKAQLGFLASDWTEGRMAAEKGASLSADYIASMLQLFGLKPGGDIIQAINPSDKTSHNERSYFQNFVLLKTVEGEQNLSISSSEGELVKRVTLARNVDYKLRPAGYSFEIEAPIVFTGYGYVNERLKYNDFRKTDVKGKFILKIAGIPGFLRKSLTPEETASGNSNIESVAIAMGAIGIIEVNPENLTVGKPEERDFENMAPAEKITRSGGSRENYSLPINQSSDDLVRIFVSVKTANEILKGSGTTIEDYIRKSEDGGTQPKTDLKGKTVFLKSTITTTQVAVKNVIGVIEGNNPDQIIVLGAHYDHMGNINGYIWNGADDNGSGTIGAMSIAKAIMETGIKPEKTIIVALWTAEEEGLLGSRYYVQNLGLNVKKIKLNVNFDMISRYISSIEPRKVSMIYTNTYQFFKDLTDKNIKRYGIDLMVDYQPSADPPGGSDHRSFVAAGVPVIRFKAGHREEYHTPKDEIGTVNWDIMREIVRISFVNVWELANTTW